MIDIRKNGFRDDEPRDANGRWSGGGVHAAASAFFGRLGKSVHDGWRGLSDAERAVAYGAIAGVTGMAILRGVNHLPLVAHAHVADFFSSASKYISSAAPIGHAATAAATAHVGAKLLEGGFPRAAGQVRGVAAALTAAAAAATHPKVREFLAKAAKAVSDAGMTRLVGKSLFMPSIGSVSGEPVTRQANVSADRLRHMTPGELYEHRARVSEARRRR